MTTSLRKMRQFYRMFEIRDAVRLVSGVDEIRHMVCGELSWSHYHLHQQVVEPAGAGLVHAGGGRPALWSTRQLDRQISVLYYERLLASREKAPVRKEARDKLAAVAPEEFIRDPYVLDFLGLKDYPALRESAVVLIRRLHSSMGELINARP